MKCWNYFWVSDTHIVRPAVVCCEWVSKVVIGHCRQWHYCTVYRMDCGTTWRRPTSWCPLQCRSVAMLRLPATLRRTPTHSLLMQLVLRRQATLPVAHITRKVSMLDQKHVSPDLSFWGNVLGKIHICSGCHLDFIAITYKS